MQVVMGMINAGIINDFIFVSTVTSDQLWLHVADGSTCGFTSELRKRMSFLQLDTMRLLHHTLKRNKFTWQTLEFTWNVVPSEKYGLFWTNIADYRNSDADGNDKSACEMRSVVDHTWSINETLATIQEYYMVKLWKSPL